MAVPVKVPTLGLTISNVTIMEWKVAEGTKVDDGAPLVSVETDKVTFDVIAPVGGYVLKILENAGNRVDVEKTIIAIIGAESENIADLLGGSSDVQTVHEPVEEPAPSASPKEMPETLGKANAMPAVRRLAKKYGVDIDSIKGSGLDGIVTKDDVENYYLASQKKTSASVDVADQEDQLIPFSGIRRQIANHMVNSLKTAAHVTILDEVDMTQVVALRKELEKDTGNRISFVAFSAKAAANAVKRFPVINSVIDGDQIRIKNYINMNIAVASGENLLVPVLHNIEKKNLFEIACELEDLIKTARNGNLTPQMMLGGTLTISNPGPFGTLISTPIINQPQSALLWMGRIAKKAVVIDDAIVIRSMMYMCLSYDHRVMDGFIAAQYLQELKRQLQNPGMILANRS